MNKLSTIVNSLYATGLSIRDVAKICGYSRSVVHKWGAGQSRDDINEDPKAAAFDKHAALLKRIGAVLDRGVELEKQVPVRPSQYVAVIDRNLPAWYREYFAMWVLTHFRAKRPQSKQGEILATILTVKQRPAGPCILVEVPEEGRRHLRLTLDAKAFLEAAKKGVDHVDLVDFYE